MRRNKKSISFFKIILALLILTFFANSLYKNLTTKPVDKNDDSKLSIQIKKGASYSQALEQLKENGLIKSKTATYFYGKSQNLDTKILAGRFYLSKNMSAAEILETLTNPSKAEFVITIQEGLRVRDIDAKLVELGLIKSGEFIQANKDFSQWDYYPFIDKSQLANLEIPTEGFIYPDTYFLDPATFEAQDLIFLAMDNFERKLKEINLNTETGRKYNLHQILTMASIIENEVFGSKDRKKVSGILWKRLENNWALGADATILYITEDRHISSADLSLDSPYNSRKNLGLPPGPISNPSIDAIEAALNPEKTNFWFYLTTLDTGEVIYAQSNEEHNENRRKYL